MNKDDVKAIILIFIMLLLISGILILGIRMYNNMMMSLGEKNETSYVGNTTTIILPEEKKNVIVVDSGQNILNQIETPGNQTQVTQPNIQEENTNEKEEYYYKQLSSYSKLIYDKLEENKTNMKSGTYKVDFGDAFSELLENENGTQLLQEYYQSAIETYLYDNPEVFYLDANKMYINIQTTKKFLWTTYEVFIDSGENPNYLYDGYNSMQEVIECENIIKREAQKILNQVTGKSDYQKILLIHDYLVDNVVYDQSINKEHIYNIYGALANKEAVCEGYAKAFKYLMDQIEIETILVIGVATDSNEQSQSHAWNYVNLNNVWYAIDVTWDDPVIIGGGTLSRRHKYRYFLKGSTTMSEDHTESYTFVQNGKAYTHPILSLEDY